MALITAPSAGVVPPSPPPRRPSGFEVDGTSLISVANGGAPWTVEWLENGIDVMVAGNTAIGDRLLELAGHV